LNELNAAAEGWTYDDAASIVWLKTPDRGVAMRVQILD
jgi:hypothetical protein